MIALSNYTNVNRDGKIVIILTKQENGMEFYQDIPEINYLKLENVKNIKFIGEIDIRDFNRNPEVGNTTDEKNKNDIKNSGAYLLDITGSQSIAFDRLKLIGKHSLSDNTSSEEWNRNAPSGISIKEHKLQGDTWIKSTGITIGTLDIRNVQLGAMLNGKHIKIDNLSISKFSRDACSIQDSDVTILNFYADNSLKTVPYNKAHRDILQINPNKLAREKHGENMAIKRITINNFTYRQIVTGGLHNSMDNFIIGTDCSFENINIRDIDIIANLEGNIIYFDCLRHSTLMIKQLKKLNNDEHVGQIFNDNGCSFNYNIYKNQG